MGFFNSDRNKHKELPIPEPTTTDPNATEIARIWVAHGKQIVALKPDVWEDPGAWGLMLVDFAKHVADAYEQMGKGKKEDVLKRIKWGFDAEWNAPTGNPKVTLE